MTDNRLERIARILDNIHPGTGRAENTYTGQLKRMLDTTWKGRLRKIKGVIVYQFEEETQTVKFYLEPIDPAAPDKKAPKKDCATCKGKGTIRVTCPECQ